MPSRHELNLRARAVGFDPATSGFANDSKLEQKVLWLEKRAAAVTGTAAASTLTSDNTNVADADTVTVGSTTYTYKTTLVAGTPNQVLIGADADTSLTNLRSAINGTGTAGTDYTAATPRPNQDVSCGAVTAHAVILTARETNAGSDLATTETSAHLSFTGATLNAGTAAVAGIIATPAVNAAGAGVKDTNPGVAGDRNVSV